MDDVGDSAERASRLKHTRYEKAWKLSKGDLLPLSFETSGYLDADNNAAFRRLIRSAFPSSADDTKDHPDFTSHYLRLRANASNALCLGHVRILSNYCQRIVPLIHNRGVGAGAGAGQGADGAAAAGV